MSTQCSDAVPLPARSDITVVAEAGELAGPTEALPAASRLVDAEVMVHGVLVHRAVGVASRDAPFGDILLEGLQSFTTDRRPTSVR